MFMQFIYKRFSIIWPIYQYDEQVDLLINKSSFIKKVIIKDQDCIKEDITEKIKELQLFLKLQNLTPNILLNNQEILDVIKESINMIKKFSQQLFLEIEYEQNEELQCFTYLINYDVSNQLFLTSINNHIKQIAKQMPNDIQTFLKSNEYSISITNNKYEEINMDQFIEIMSKAPLLRFLMSFNITENNYQKGISISHLDISSIYYKVQLQFSWLKFIQQIMCNDEILLKSQLLENPNSQNLYINEYKLFNNWERFQQLQTSQTNLHKHKCNQISLNVKSLNKNKSIYSLLKSAQLDLMQKILDSNNNNPGINQKLYKYQIHNIDDSLLEVRIDNVSYEISGIRTIEEIVLYHMKMLDDGCKEEKIYELEIIQNLNQQQRNSNINQLDKGKSLALYRYPNQKSKWKECVIIQKVPQNSRYKHKQSNQKDFYEIKFNSIPGSKYNQIYIVPKEDLCIRKDINLSDIHKQKTQQQISDDEDILYPRRQSLQHQNPKRNLNKYLHPRRQTQHIGKTSHLKNKKENKKLQQRRRQTLQARNLTYKNKNMVPLDQKRYSELLQQLPTYQISSSHTSTSKYLLDSQQFQQLIDSKQSINSTKKTIQDFKEDNLYSRNNNSNDVYPNNQPNQFKPTDDQNTSQEKLLSNQNSSRLKPTQTQLLLQRPTKESEFLNQRSTLCKNVFPVSQQQLIDLEYSNDKQILQKLHKPKNKCITDIKNPMKPVHPEISKTNFNENIYLNSYSQRTVNHDINGNNQNPLQPKSLFNGHDVKSLSHKYHYLYPSSNYSVPYFSSIIKNQSFTCKDNNEPAIKIELFYKHTQKNTKIEYQTQNQQKIVEDLELKNIIKNPNYSQHKYIHPFFRQQLKSEQPKRYLNRYSQPSELKTANQFKYTINSQHSQSLSQQLKYQNPIAIYNENLYPSKEQKSHVKNILKLNEDLNLSPSKISKQKNYSLGMNSPFSQKRHNISQQPTVQQKSKTKHQKPQFNVALLYPTYSEQQKIQNTPKRNPQISYSKPSPSPDVMNSSEYIPKLFQNEGLLLYKESDDKSHVHVQRNRIHYNLEKSQDLNAYIPNYQQNQPGYYTFRYQSAKLPEQSEHLNFQKTYRKTYNYNRQAFPIDQSKMNK